MDNKKASPLGNGVRRKSGGNSQLRSPTAKRSPLAPVAQKGWLLKQGSEGLMLWKKRWCVLAEHCLFYYKTPEEEKILGSILLPSYKVSPCSGDDKIYKKFAFKVEHANMRTYVFAAETREAMVQWMNALSLSTILQDLRDLRDDEAGFTVTRQPVRRNDIQAVNGWVPHQPLYANAPPKPRRVGNENSPEPSPDLHISNQHYHPYPYVRQNGFVHPGYVRAANPHVPNYQHPNQYYQGYNQLSPPPPPVSTINAHQVTPRRTYHPPRPHSADFLDYDAKKYYEYQETTVVKTTDIKMDSNINRKRPKSSLDIVQNNDEKYYWSEERYAEKMRQSAMYLQQRIAESPTRRWEQPDNFTRSASARLSRQAPEDEESDEVTTYMGGEESMKRLLEWKQRMLASPLTRKPSGSSGRGSAQNELSKYYKQQVLRELERQEARSREEAGRRRLKPEGNRYRSRSTDGRRPAGYSSNRYNSYSSDDEEKEEQSSDRIRRSSQSGKIRKNVEEAKDRPDLKPVTSPDYENLTELPVARSGRASAPPIKTYKRTPKEEFPDKLKATFQEPQLNSENVKNGKMKKLYPSHSSHDNEDNFKQVWNEKLDESKLIKEFSYQYISKKSPEDEVQTFRPLESPPQNIVKSRIKQLGLNVKDEENIDSGLKEPLKISSPTYLLNEAFVSHLRSPDSSDELQDRRNNKNLKTFALGHNKQDEPEIIESPDKNPKSVKDLLADFERKSLLAQERLEHEKNFEDAAGKRCVFSDTETLLYDTSSDTDDRKPSADPAILNTLRKPECINGESADQTEEEGDEEVAAALGRRDRFFSSCREMNRKQEQSLKVKKISKSTDERRLSVTDSLVVNEDSESACSTPTIDMIKDNLEKTLPKENVKMLDREIPEGHYMPMSPSRRVSAPPSDKSRSNSSLHSVLYGVEIEETYVEMTENGPNDSFLAKNRPALSRFNNANFPEETNESHYDFLYRSSSQHEPEYMEVNNLLSAIKENIEIKKEEIPPTPPRSALPDILNSSSTQPLKSDSSDADDESSKDLDSLDTPSHPRFSLSDTFRPASYYLGNIMGAVVERTASENHDSSDSDLVSPPPIPTSPPPLEDLDTSLETENSLDMSTHLSTPRKLKISDHDLSKRLWSKPRQIDSKRLPVTENMIECLDDDDFHDHKPSLPLELAGKRSGVAMDEESCEINLDMYLEDLQLGNKVNPQTYSKDFRSYEMQRNLTENINKNDVSDKNLMKLRYPDDDVIPIPQEVEYENLHAMFPPPPPELYESSDQSDRENGLSLSLYRNALDVPPPASYCDNNNEVSDRSDPPPSKVRFDPDTLLQKDLDAQAPYYYSDIIKNDSAGPSVLSSMRLRYQPLNNQREDLHEAQQGQKRNDIGRKVNPINQIPVAEAEEVSDVQKITAELRNTSADFMGDANKMGSVDMRNIYESDTLQRRKEVPPLGMIRIRTPDLHHPQGISRNLYPHGIRNKSEEGTSQPVIQPSMSVRISRSVEGLLEDAVVRPQREIACADDLWDEDSLWRESLRRVSRSLDNLDENHSEPTSRDRIPSGRRSVTHFASPSLPVQSNSGRRSVDHCTTRPKLSRDVTYVNDGAKRALAAEYEQDYREGRRLQKKPDHRPMRELPDSGVQDCDDGVHYERLKRDSDSADNHRRSDVYLDNYDWDADREVFHRDPKCQAPFLDQASHPHIEPIDRERLRQWDLMSSGTGGDVKLESSAKDEIKDQPVQPVHIPSNHTTITEASASGSVMREAHIMPPQAEEATIPISRSVPAIMLTEDSPQEPQPRLDPRLDPRMDPRLDPRTDQNSRNDYYRKGYRPSSNGYHNWEAYTPYDGRENNTYHEHRRPLNEYNLDHRIANQRVPDPRMAYYGKQSVSGGGTLPHSKPSPTDASSASGRSVGTLPLTKSSSGRGPNRQPDMRQMRDFNQPGKREKSVGGPGNGAPWGLDVSAGELLGRTHEELVLLLIQLRRQSAGVCKAMEACHIDIEAQARLAELETPKRMEHLQKLEELKRHLLELEKQYEKGKPLVNLVDNMVKLGSLYRGNDSPSSNSISPGVHVREKLEFNQKVQEQRMLAEERREWDRLSPDQNQLQAKVQQLYKLDRLLQEESVTLQSLQQDKELLEKALGGLRHKLQESKGNPAEADRWRQQQKLLQKELSRVRLLLAHNSKKLEETVAENARLEQELVILRQKLQANRSELSGRSNSSLLETSTTSTTQALEAELRRVQNLVGDLQRQRQELSVQVRQLTEKSDTLVQQIRPGPTGVAGAGAIPSKKRLGGTWLETDLDLQNTLDVAVTTPLDSPQHLPSPPKPQDSSTSTTPIYINTDLNRKDVTSPSHSITESQCSGMVPVELSEADERMKRYYGIIPREKQEIKTVRIVKRESERRQRDRDRSGNIGLPLTSNATAKRVAVVDEVDEEESQEGSDVQNQDPYAHFHPTNPFLPNNLGDPQRSMSLPRGFGGKAPPPPVRHDQAQSLRTSLVKRNRVRFEQQQQHQDWSESDSGANSPRVDSPLRQNGIPPAVNQGERTLSAREQLFGPAPKPVEASPQLSPVYQSEAAREIVEEMARNATPNRRQVPKEKRRHHTVSNIRLFIDPADRVNTSRARDDLDMERALRPRINAPDVVRSTLSQRDLKYNESTIDTILGTPNKIVIPERYIPETEPILTAEEQLHRLRKADSIRKMLSETSALSTPDLSAETAEEEKKSATLRKKVDEEKRQREHLLQLNQILAQQVMEKSKLVAVKALAQLPLQPYDGHYDEEDLSPIQPLPLYQQRENFYS